MTRAVFPSSIVSNLSALICVHARNRCHALKLHSSCINSRNQIFQHERSEP